MKKKSEKMSEQTWGTNQVYEKLKNQLNELNKTLKIQNKLINTIPSPLFAKDEDFVYTSCNAAFESYLGIPKEKIINATVYDIAPKKLADVYYKADCDLRDKKEIQIYEANVKYADGSLHDIMFHKAPIIDENDEFCGIVGIMLDITERKNHEKLINGYIQELKKLNATKDKLFSIIAHDLRGPIGNFLSTIELLTGDEFVEEDIKEKLLGGLKKSSRSTFNLLENLLNWSRSQIETINIQPTHFAINDLIRNNIELFSMNAQQKAINIEVRAGDKFDVFADKESMNVVFRNLLSNAIKFTYNEGHILISISERDPFIEVEILDDGVGINEEVVKNILQADFLHSSVGTNGEKGSGIGLVLCKDFVEKNGGTIRAESIPGKGSKFIFTIPKA